MIDMGSNSWRLVVYGYEPGTPWWSLVDEIREPVRVSAGMAEEGAIRPERFELALHTAAVFSAFCRASGVGEIEAVATSAIRDARNGPDLLERIEEHSGLVPRVISGGEEARYGSPGRRQLHHHRGRPAGSTWAAAASRPSASSDRRMVDSISRPLGSVRVSEDFLPGEKATGKAQKALRRHVADELGGVEWWEGGGRLVGTGGTIRNLASAAMKRLDLPDIDVQGFLLTRDAVEELIDELASRPASKRGNVRGIKPDRGDVILGGALVLAAAMETGGFEAVEVTEAGLREGIFFERLLGERRLFDDLRTESVENLAHRFVHDPEHAHHVAALSLQMFDGLAAAGLHDYGALERELLWAACILHDIGTAIDYDDHHRHSHYLILNAGLPGFTPRELVLIGLIARYHRKGEPDASELGDLAEKGDGRRLLLLCAIIRLAEQFERSRDRSIGSVSVATANGTVELRPVTDSGGDPSVPVWAARRNADLLAGAVERPVDVTDPA